MACSGVYSVLGTLAVFLISEIAASGEFHLEILSFKNDLGLTEAGSCCSGYAQPNLTCSSTCKTYFITCLKNFQRVISPNQCHYGTRQTQVLGENSFNLLGGHLEKFNFQFEWRGDFSLIVDAFYETSVGSASGPGHAKIYQAKFSGKALPTQSWQTETTRHAGKELQVRYRVLCSPNYHGSGCNKLCTPRDDTVGHYSCDTNGNKVCLPGWTGTYCDRAVCLEGCSSQHGHCSRPGDCACRTGWKGRYCTECVPAKGCSRGTCRNPGECNCEDGWGGGLCNNDLYFCSRKRPCQNGASCTNVGSGSYKCDCLPGFTGTNCEQSLYNCQVDPCLNGGSCSVITSSSTRCTCPPGYYGIRCEGSCTTTKCANGGTCSGAGRTYSCTCPPGWGGKDCQLKTNPCHAMPCQNGGTCGLQGDGYTCSCTEGFTGPQCKEARLQCSNNPCQNGGACRELSGQDRDRDYECKCKPGFVGINCELYVDYCATLKPCSNGGICKPENNGYNCECPKQWEGKNCDGRIDFCKSNPCENEGSCMHSSYVDFECKCPPGYEGLRCQLPKGHGSSTDPSDPSHGSSAVDNTTVTPSPVNARPDTVVSDGAAIGGEMVILAITLGVALPLALIFILIGCYLLRRHRRKAAAGADEKIEDYPDSKGMNNADKAAALKRQATDGFSSELIINALDRPNHILPHQSNKMVEKQKFNDIIKNRENMERSSTPVTCTSSPEAPSRYKDIEDSLGRDWLNPSLLLQQQLAIPAGHAPPLNPNIQESEDPFPQVENVPSAGHRHSSLATMV